MKRLLPYTSAVFFIFGVYFIPLPLLAASADSPVTLDRLVFARSVEAREPVGAGREFEASVSQVFCWTKLSTKSPPAAVRHVWYKDGQKLLEVPLTVIYSSGRYWSAKNISTGNWTVEVMDANGEVFGAASFTVK